MTEAEVADGLELGPTTARLQIMAASWEQYDGVTDAVPAVTVIAETGHSVWADVTWSYGGQPRERFMYQLVGDADGRRIAVLTPLQLPG